MPTPQPSPLAELPIRRLTRGDLISCADLCEDRGWPRDEHRWGLLLTAGTGYGIDAPDGKGLIASCVVTSYGPRLSAIGMLLVAGRYSRQGVARRLMRYVMESAGMTALSLYATVEGQSLYKELGFSSVGRAVRVSGYFRTACDAPGRTSPAPTVSTRPATAADLPAMLRLDSEVFGPDRMHLLTRLPAFSDRLRVAEDADGLAGYGALWPSGNAHVVGPLIARDAATAKALVSSLAVTTDRPLRADIDARHGELLGWLASRDLKPDGPGTTVMTHGNRDLPGDWARRFAPLSVATG